MNKRFTIRGVKSPPPDAEFFLTKDYDGVINVQACLADGTEVYVAEISDRGLRRVGGLNDYETPFPQDNAGAIREVE